MPDLRFELEQLTMADEHIRAAERRVAAMRARLREISDPLSPEEEAALAAAENSLEAFRDHRRLIARVVAQVRSGELPDTSDYRPAAS